MKILLSIFPAFLYLLLSLNITFNVHYCNHEFKSLTFLDDNNTYCCSAMEVTFCASKVSCCESTRFSFLFGADEKITKPISISSRDFQLVKIKEIIKTSPVLKQNQKLNHLFCDLPPPLKKAIYKQNCSLIFYG